MLYRNAKARFSGARYLILTPSNLQLLLIPHISNIKTMYVQTWLRGHVNFLSEDLVEAARNFTLAIESAPST